MPINPFQQYHYYLRELCRYLSGPIHEDTKMYITGTLEWIEHWASELRRKI